MKDTLLILFWMILSQSLPTEQEVESVNVKHKSLYPFHQRVDDYIEYGYINRKGEIVVEPSFDYADGFYEGKGLVIEEGKFGFINAKGEMVIKPQFDYAEGFSEGLAYAVKGEKAGFIDTNGQFQIDLDKEEIYDADNYGCLRFHNGVIAIDTLIVDSKRDSDGKYYYLDKEGNRVDNQLSGLYYLDKKGNSVDKHKGEVLYFTYEGKYNLNLPDRSTICFDKNMDTLFVTPYKADIFKEGLAAFVDDEKALSGYLNTKGEVVIPAKFILASEFFEGFGIVLFSEENRKQGLDDSAKGFGLIDTKGNFVVPPIYDYLEGYWNGLCLVGERKKLKDKSLKETYSYLDKNFKKVFTFSVTYKTKK